MKYFEASGLFGACRLGGIFDPFKRPFGLYMYATEILNFDKYLFLFHMSLGYKTWGLIKTFKVKPSLGKKPEKEKEYPLQKLYIKTKMQQI